jgi:hypothetical protein
LVGQKQVLQVLLCQQQFAVAFGTAVAQLQAPVNLLMLVDLAGKVGAHHLLAGDLLV